MTELLYCPDNEYQKSFEAEVEKVDEEASYIVLDKTLFYKEGGGQPADYGKIFWKDKEASVTDVQKRQGEIRHYLEGPLPEEGEKIEGEIDWERRYSHMKMHTAQHIVSKVVLEEYEASTAGNQVGEDSSRIDFEPADFDEKDLEKIEELSNEIIEADIELEKSERPRSELEKETEDGRTNLDLIPDHIDPLRAVEIGDIDICPCGGTHVDSTGELGGLEIVDRKSKGADVERIEFVLKD
ncbi:alanyl-tRNA editing protein [Candidatus Nanosalina sp. VS9-1]|uniref:alanyl-tRNA editing protein n=1 Tax=Candidatus Nanosalina sp. VS9-1 TaxID=3388566 RepID=UPI0039E14AB4